jgi:hypothetical protein
MQRGAELRDCDSRHVRREFERETCLVADCGLQSFCPTEGCRSSLEGLAVMELQPCVALMRQQPRRQESVRAGIASASVVVNRSDRAP